MRPQRLNKKLRNLKNINPAIAALKRDYETVVVRPAAGLTDFYKKSVSINRPTQPGERLGATLYHYVFLNKK
jgi:hypothetical protein